MQSAEAVDQASVTRTASLRSGAFADRVDDERSSLFTSRCRLAGGGNLDAIASAAGPSYRATTVSGLLAVTRLADEGLPVAKATSTVLFDHSAAIPRLRAPYISDWLEHDQVLCAGTAACVQHASLTFPGTAASSVRLTSTIRSRHGRP